MKAVWILLLCMNALLALTMANQFVNQGDAMAFVIGLINFLGMVLCLVRLND